jgi:metal-sulfur cluster biosynthetic enzyme
MVDKEKVKEALKNVTDPEIGMNIVDLGLVYYIEEEAGKLKIEMTMTSPMCPATEEIVENSKQFAKTVNGVKEVEIQLVWDPPWDPDKMTDEGKAQLDFM